MLFNKIINLIPAMFIWNSVHGNSQFNEGSDNRDEARKYSARAIHPWYVVTGPVGIATFVGTIGYLVADYAWKNSKQGYSHVLVNKLKDGIYSGKEHIGPNESLSIKYNNYLDNKMTAVCVQISNKHYWVPFPKKPCCSSEWFPALDVIEDQPWFVLYQRKDNTNYFEKIHDCKMGKMVTDCKSQIEESMIDDMYYSMDYRCQAAADGGIHSR